MDFPHLRLLKATLRELGYWVGTFILLDYM